MLSDVFSAIFKFYSENVQIQAEFSLCNFMRFFKIFSYLKK